MAAGSSGAGFLSAAMLLEELRIAYRGWETAAASLETASRFARPTIADGLSDELRLAIESMRSKRWCMTARRFARPTIADGLSDELRLAIESMRSKR